MSEVNGESSMKYDSVFIEEYPYNRTFGDWLKFGFALPRGLNVSTWQLSSGRLHGFELYVGGAETAVHLNELLLPDGSVEIEIQAIGLSGDGWQEIADEFVCELKTKISEDYREWVMLDA